MMNSLRISTHSWEAGHVCHKDMYVDEDENSGGLGP